MAFRDDIRKFAKKLAIKEEQAIAQFCMSLSMRIDNISPVRDGGFRANWVAALDKPYAGPVLPPDVTGRVTEAFPVAASALGHIYYFTNKLPYAQRLEYGWSDQAPAGVVRVSVRQSQAYLNKAVRDVR